MKPADWKTFVANLALFVQKTRHEVARGTLRVWLSQPKDCILAAYGNENYSADGKVRQGVEMVRQRLRGMAIAELGFALSPDGRTWALAISADHPGCVTEIGKAFHREMLMASLEELLIVGNRATAEVDFELP
ncbi:MAG: hypothetical protein K2R98_27955 [Gemmataceae bacterium]|nr:hypothetical protein [Gemmataceae bacterium]